MIYRIEFKDNITQDLNMVFRLFVTVLLLLLVSSSGHGAFTSVTLTAPSVVWEQNTGSITCQFPEVASADVAELTWYRNGLANQVYFYNSTTESALGDLLGRASGALGVREFTLDITNVTLAAGDGTDYTCAVIDVNGTEVSNTTNLNVQVLCNPNPCVNGGTCTITSSSNYTCACTTSYTGQNCENNLLPVSTASASGELTVTGSAPTTSSPTTSSGPCDSSPCQNDGICTTNPADITAYLCSCNISFTGINCETTVVLNECLSSPCLNNATCSDLPESYSCSCTSCWTGKNCDTQLVNECSSNPCQNGGSCVDHCFGYSCNCPFDYGGTNCQNTCSNIQTITNAQTVVIGSKVTLTCAPVSGSPSITWSKSSTGTPTIGSGSTYTIQEVVANEGDFTYYCFATLNGCTSRKSTSVSATWAVQFNGTVYRNLTLNERDDLDLTGGIEATPSALVYWRFTGLSTYKTVGNQTVEVTPDPVVLTNRTYDNSTIRIAKVTVENAGIYECIAELPGITYLLNFHMVLVVGDDKDGGGLKWWIVLLIVLGVLILIAIIVVIILVILLKKKKRSVEPNDREKGKYNQENRDVGNAKRSYKGSPRTTKYAHIDETEKYSEKPKDEAYHSDMELKPKKNVKKKRMLQRRAERDDDDDGDGGRADDSPRPLPNFPKGRGRTLPPLNVNEEKGNVQKKKKKKLRTYDNEEDQRYGRRYSDES